MKKSIITTCYYKILNQKVRSSQAQDIHPKLFRAIKSKDIDDANRQLKVFHKKIRSASNNQLMETSQWLYKD